jgi:hypothetical protein
VFYGTAGGARVKCDRRETAMPEQRKNVLKRNMFFVRSERADFFVQPNRGGLRRAEMLLYNVAASH